MVKADRMAEFGYQKIDDKGGKEDEKTPNTWVKSSFKPQLLLKPNMLTTECSYLEAKQFTQ